MRNLRRLESGLYAPEEPGVCSMMLGLGLGLGFQGVTQIPFLPTSITDLAAWYRADMGVTIVTGVSEWADQSGLGDANRNALQANALKQPTLNAADANVGGQASISTSVLANQYLTTGAWSVALVQPFAVFLVGYATASAAWAFDSSAGGEVGVVNHGANTRLYAGSFGADVAQAAVATPGVFIANFDSASTKTALGISQNTPQAGANIGTDAPAPLIIGASQGGGIGNCAWTIAELAFWTRDLTSTEIGKLNTYAAARYGITIGS